MLAPSPYLELFAFSIASSKLDTLQIGATGPKLSLLNMLISSLQSTSTVGATNQPLLN